MVEITLKRRCAVLIFNYGGTPRLEKHEFASSTEARRYCEELESSLPTIRFIHRSTGRLGLDRDNNPHLFVSLITTI